MQNTHVRKCSEGYLVRSFTAEEREALVFQKMNNIQDNEVAPLDVDEESSTDFDSLDEYSDEDEKEKKGIPRLLPNAVNNEVKDDESDSEPLYVLKNKLLKKRK